jgi:UDP-N-acetylmuramate dehydrogenase
MGTAIIYNDYNLQPLNTLAVPSTARWFTEIVDESSLISALDFVARHGCPLFVLGGGSNVVLGKYFPGLVIKMAIAGIEVVSETDDVICLTIGAGESWHQLVLWCARRGYYGIENLALIPGTVGAAPIQNIGAYGVELADVFCHLHAINIASRESCQLNRDDCQFGYRDSIFKHQLKDRMVITQVSLYLHKTPRWNFSYPALKKAIEVYSTAMLSAQLIAETVMAIRQSKLPDPKTIPNVGSFFMNPLVTANDYQRLRQQYPDLIGYPAINHLETNDGYKLAAGWLLDNAGWRGKFTRGIGMHDQQALVLVNSDRQSGSAVLAFAQSVQADIVAKYGIQLDIEPRIYA